MRQWITAFALVAAVEALSSSAPAGCPAYTSIAQPSVREGAFSPAELRGVWYLVATNEPTMPPFCKCGVNRFTDVDLAAKTYSYRNIDDCAGVNMTIPIKGKLSSNPATPGMLRENFAPWNSTHGFPYLPNMVFDVLRGGNGGLEVVFAYACLGKIPVKGDLFSFNIMARRFNRTRDEIESLVSLANTTTRGVLDMSGMRYNDASVYHDCNM